MECSKIGPSGPAARSRPPAEGCSFTSQAHPLGCGLAAVGNRCRRHRRLPRWRRVPSLKLVAGPSARLRACLGRESRSPASAAPPVEACTLVEARSRPVRSAAGLSRGGKVPLSTGWPQAATEFNFEVRISALKRPCGPQPPAAKARSSRPAGPLARSLRRLRPEAGFRFAPAWAQQPAAAPRRRAASSRCSKAGPSARLRARPGRTRCCRVLHRGKREKNR